LCQFQKFMIKTKHKLCHFIIAVLSICFIQSSCKESNSTPQNKKQTSTTKSINPNKSDIENRFSAPKKYERTELQNTSFQSYLRSLKLKQQGSTVSYFDGSTKPNNGVYVAVVDLEIGTKDLHQCADAVMRLRAEYLWEAKKYDAIHFNFTNGFNVKYSEWMKGKRMKIEGYKTWWEQESDPSNTYEDLWNYLELIFTYAGTASLAKELKSVKTSEAKIGDVLIQGGHPGHAVIIVDEVEHIKSGKKLFLLAQSYMPAQEIQILSNPKNNGLNPWYDLSPETIITPEWTFNSTDLKRFVN